MTLAMAKEPKYRGAADLILPRNAENRIFELFRINTGSVLRGAYDYYPLFLGTSPLSL